MRLTSLALLTSTACAVGDPSPPADDTAVDPGAELTANAKVPRYAGIRDAAGARGIVNAYLLAGIANDETGLAMCWSEATWACQGPASSDCGGGPVIAGSADGPCSAQQGGLGMFQFDAGTFGDTVNRYGAGVLTVAGQTAAAIDYATWMVKTSVYTTDAETDDKARAWINRFDPNNGALRDQWIKTVVRYYNGCQPDWSCWGARYQTYSDGYRLAIDEPGGLAFWSANVGTRCGNSPAVVGEIEQKYNALGGCGSFLGAPTTEERGALDHVGRYSVFERGSIYWTSALGAFEVHGVIRDAWKQLGWEAGLLGYPTSDESPAADGVGRYSVFEHGSIYWTAAVGAFEVQGRIRDAWRDTGAETGELGYPTSNEYAVTGGRRSDFQHGSITWNSSTNQTSITRTTP
ncbi:MAG: hypothetical protein NT062_09175 [Proteobacteria bacterium]|nr:hypothetical protein [Pseudomonadota bacterium]